MERAHVGGAGQQPHGRQIANVFFAAQGLFTIIAARLGAANPNEETTDWRAVCGRKPPARFGGRGRREPFRPPINRPHDVLEFCAQDLEPQ
jgi:hypothetical protein